MHTEDIELKVMLEAIYLRYGYDFRGYAEASLKRRLKHLLRKADVESFSQLQHALLHRPEFFASSLPDFTVTTSEMFRDPSFFKALRDEVIPVLATYPAFKIWHAGCSTGEEVYSLAILLKEEGLYDRAVIYATDVNSLALKAAREGIYRAEAAKDFTANYQQSGGKGTLSDYYTALYGSVRFDAALRENVVFSDHNLVTDEVFSEVNLVVCRNVLIYFSRELQDRVVNLFTRSLAYKGFLCLGSKETVRFLSAGASYREFIGAERIFQKTAPDGPINMLGEP